MESLVAQECRFLAKYGMESFSLESCAEATMPSSVSEPLRLAATLASVYLLRHKSRLSSSWIAAAFHAGLVLWLESGEAATPTTSLVRLAWTMISCFSEYPAPRMACFVALCALQPQYALLLPLVAWPPSPHLSTTESGGTQHQAVLSRMLRQYFYLFVVVALVAVGATTCRSHLPGTILAVLSSRTIPPALFAASPTGIPSPSPGVLWYLHTMILPEHSTYFSLLIAIQPALATLFLASILLPFGSTPLMELAFVMLQIYQSRPDVSGIGLMLIALLETEEGKVAAAMRHLPWMLMAITVPALVSPVMRHLWLHWGTGNANFLFFQGYVQWVSLALFVLEYVTAYVKLKHGECCKGEGEGL